MGELPVDGLTAPISSLVPGPNTAGQICDFGDAVGAEALAVEDTNLDLGLVEPATMLGRVVDIEAVPEVTSALLAVVSGDRLHEVCAQLFPRVVDK